MRAGAVLGALALLCLGLLSCGGNSSTTASTSAKAVQPQAAEEKGGSATPKEASARAKSLGSSAAERIPAKLKEQAGKAAPFLLAGADNSIPTYGSEGSGSQQIEARSALAGYLKAREAGRWGSACALMGKAVRGQLRVLAEGSGRKAPTCTSAFAVLAKYNPPSTRKSVLIGPLAAFRVRRDRGFALFYGPHRQQFMMPMVREGGAWKVSQSIPIAYPIGAPVRGR